MEERGPGGRQVMTRPETVLSPLVVFTGGFRYLTVVRLLLVLSLSRSLSIKVVIVILYCLRLGQRLNS